MKKRRIGTDQDNQQQTVTDGGLDSEELVKIVREGVSADIIADIVGHPREGPTVEEIVYMNPAHSHAEIQSCLSELSKKGVINERQIASHTRCPDLPSAYFVITDAARSLFDQNGLFPTQPWRRQYQAVTKADRIQTIEQLPRSVD